MRRAKERPSKGKWKTASAFKFSHMTLMFQPRTSLYFDVCSQAGVSCRLPITIWVPRNVSKLLGCSNSYSAKYKPTFWQPPLNIFRVFCLSICKRPSLSNTQWQDRGCPPLLGYCWLGNTFMYGWTQAICGIFKTSLRSCWEMAFLFSYS